MHADFIWRYSAFSGYDPAWKTNRLKTLRSFSEKRVDLTSGGTVQMTGGNDNMRRAVYPGSFDPVTNGHLDIIRRSAALVDELVVGVLINHSKIPLFSVDERVKMLKDVTQNLSNVRVESFTGLTVDFLKAQGAGFMIRGLRAITDFEYELQMAQTNRVIAPAIDTIFLTTSLEYAYLSSTTVKEVALYGGDISQFVPPLVAENIWQKMGIKVQGSSK